MPTTHDDDPMLRALSLTMAGVTGGEYDALCVVARNKDGTWSGWATAPIGAHADMVRAALGASFADEKRQNAARPR